jgi:uncharacterized membrane protein YphA (DoxX/SURF4 family)
MKITVTISRILVGALFAFSGLVKAIDPLGLAYKMQEFFEVWAGSGFMPKAMDWLHGHALWFSVFMITLEVVLGIALLLGYRAKLVSFFLLLLTLFFTFLTAYVLFSGKIRACGCFGDCIPLTPVQTFNKDIVLLLLVLLILYGVKYINPLLPGQINAVLVFLSLLGVLVLQGYVLRHLPLKDCLPFKPGNNILELRKMPKDAIADKYDYSFVYKKNGKQQEFKVEALPDSTWDFVERKQKLVEKGKNNIPLINDFILTTESGNDTTEAILSQPGKYYLLFAKEFNQDEDTWYGDFMQFVSTTKRPVYLVTADRKAANEIFKKTGVVKLLIFTCDGIAIKTAARVNPTLYRMNGPVIKNKWSWGDAKTVVQ